MTWTVGTRAGLAETFDWEQTPESVVADITCLLTDPHVLDGRTYFSCGVQALPDGVVDPTRVPDDDPSLMNYMHVGGRRTGLTLEVRVADADGYTHEVVAAEPVKDPDAWVELSWDHGGGSTYSTSLHPEELLTGEQAVPFFRDYVLYGKLPRPELRRRLDV